MKHRPSAFARPRFAVSARSQAAFTLIELMIALTIGLAILGGLISVLSATSSNAKTNDRAGELLTNGRYALNSIKQEVREAGFRAYTWAEPTAAPSLGGLTNECLEAGSAAGTFVSNLRQGVWGANNANPFAATCIPAASFVAGNDVLVMRRVSVVPVATGTSTTGLQANSLYFLSSYARGELFRGATLPTWANGVGSAAPAPLATFGMQVYVYYISPFTVSEAESPRVPALYRVALQPGVAANPAMTRELVATGIERMQLQYGRRTTALSTQYLNAGDAPLTRGSSFAEPNDWEEVTSVRIWLLARSTTAEPGLDPSAQSYTMGDETYTPPNDGFRRQLLSTVAQLRN